MPSPKFNNDIVRCAHCQGEEWNTYLTTDEEGDTHLLVCCANKECMTLQRERLDGEEGALVVSFDVVIETNNGFEGNIIDKPEILN